MARKETLLRRAYVDQVISGASETAGTTPRASSSPAISTERTSVDGAGGRSLRSILPVDANFGIHESTTACHEGSSTVRGRGDKASASDNICGVPPGRRIYHPNQCDVLFGRGRPFQLHPGNVHLQKLVSAYRGRYLKSTKSEKQMIIKAIVCMVKQIPGRFLKRAGAKQDFWVEQSDTVAIGKVSHALRDKFYQERDKDCQERDESSTSPEERVPLPLQHSFFPQHSFPPPHSVGGGIRQENILGERLSSIPFPVVVNPAAATTAGLGVLVALPSLDVVMLPVYNLPQCALLTTTTPQLPIVRQNLGMSLPLIDGGASDMARILAIPYQGL